MTSIIPVSKNPADNLLGVEIKGGWAKIRGGQWARIRYLSDSPTRRVSRAEAEKAWKGSKYKDRWKPGKKKTK